MTSRRVAVTRGVSPSLARCELTRLARQPIDPVLASEQHAAYEALLEELGCELRRLPAEPTLPDSVFVEDAALVLPELAVITRPGAESRRPETPSVAEALAPLRDLAHIVAPGRLDGGDVLHIGRRVFVGLSTRSDLAGVEQLAGLLAPFGYRVEAVDFDGCLHLKSAVTRVGQGTLLVNEEWVDPAIFADFERVPVDPAEPCGGNALVIGDNVIYATGFEGTRRRLEERGIRTHTVDLSELAKAEGAVTCCSLIVEIG